jgi:hypothetical protein
VARNGSRHAQKRLISRDRVETGGGWLVVRH